MEPAREALTSSRVQREDVIVVRSYGQVRRIAPTGEIVWLIAVDADFGLHLVTSMHVPLEVKTLTGLPTAVVVSPIGVRRRRLWLARPSLDGSLRDWSLQKERGRAPRAHDPI